MEQEDSKLSMREKIQATRKLRKQEKQLVKKSEREEEFLTNLRKPKDTKVVLADRSLLEKLKNEKLPGSTSADRFRGFSCQDFPELSPSKSFPKQGKNALSYKSVVKCSDVLSKELFPPMTGKKSASKAASRPPSQDHSTKDVIVKVEEEKEPSNQNAAKHADVQQPGTAPKKLPSRVVTSEPKRENRKKKDPIVLPVAELLSAKPQKRDKKHVVRGSKYRRIADSYLLYGNMLDSSNPKRSKGKHREVKKLTFTKLKMAILRDRIMKLKMRENGTKDCAMDRKQFKTELLKYVNNLVVTKNAEKKKTEEAVPKETNDANVIKKEPAPEEKDCPAEKKKKNRTRYRKYCDNKYSPDLDDAVKVLIKGIVSLQDRAHAADPIKARAKHRHVTGLREVRKYLMLKKIKMLILAPDLEAQDSVNEAIEELKRAAAEQNVPCVFALSRRSLGYVTSKNIPVSAFGILSHTGLEEKFETVKEKLKEAQEKFRSQQSEASQPGTDPA
ncbi:UNVERIFIED_CONTAM: hypothetical protein PYX00_007491 [Menopon gallinae]|uniref:Ribosomal protein eL8/eL30/eS12/Gadd45 domain-containing protein n=1 Tax=Menopon gallinae TaxID=328185 RepID=A0AAW2HJF9_9NEOP